VQRLAVEGGQEQGVQVAAERISLHR
jgi:hypothetical protein